MPSIACLILTSYEDDEALFAAIMAGAAGYVLKQIRGTDLVDAVHRVAQGQSLLDPAVTATVLTRLREGSPAADPRWEALSERERAVLALIADGLSNREIGARLYLAEKMVKNHVFAGCWPNCRWSGARKSRCSARPCGSRARCVHSTRRAESADAHRQCRPFARWTVTGRCGRKCRSIAHCGYSPSTGSSSLKLAVLDDETLRFGHTVAHWSGHTSWWELQDLRSRYQPSTRWRCGSCTAGTGRDRWSQRGHLNGLHSRRRFVMATQAAHSIRGWSCT